MHHSFLLVLNNTFSKFEEKQIENMSVTTLNIYIDPGCSRHLYYQGFSEAFQELLFALIRIELRALLLSLETYRYPLDQHTIIAWTSHHKLFLILYVYILLPVTVWVQLLRVDQSHSEYNMLIYMALE